MIRLLSSISKLYIYIYIYDDDHLKLHDDLNCEKNHEHLSMNQLLVILVASVKKNQFNSKV